MKRLALLLPLAACHQTQPQPAAATPGSRLEAAARARGLVSDPAASSPVGSWANDSDRLCVAPAAGSLRFGVSVDYGDGQRCGASGNAERRGDRLRISFGDCRFEARFEGDRIGFPAELPAACDRYCTGRASLTALTVERLSGAASEAQAVRGADGHLLCGG
ncbi:hypothetical protein [Sphingomonas sp.]|uniref:hypothetical protein n=1 Tax=Sphingomonas sp. TaxID=28214 RepID=UPI003CC5AFD7